MRALVLALVAVAAAAAPAHAAWSPPQLVPGSADPPSGLSLTPGPDERALLTWSVLGANRPTGRMVAVDGDRPASAVTSLAPWDLVAAPARFGAKRTALLLQRVVRGGQRLAVAFGTTDATREPERILEMGAFVAGADIAANARGDVAVAWIEERGRDARGAYRDDRLWLASRRPGGAFGRPRLLVGSGDVTGVSVAVGARGATQVAFARAAIRDRFNTGPSRVQARFRPAGGAFGGVATLGPNAGFATLATGVTSRGRGYVAWATQDGGEEANEPLRVYGAVRTAGRYRTQTLDPGGHVERPLGRLALVLGGERAVVGWSRSGSDRIATATSGSAGRFGRRVELAGSHGAHGALTAEGTPVWTTFTDGEGSGIRAGAETVFDGPADSEEPPAAATVGGRTLVAWSGQGGIALSRR